MATRLPRKVVRRPSLPLTARDERDLALLRESPTYQQALEQLTGEAISAAGVSEAALLHAVFEAGLSAIREAAEEAGYARVAAEQADHVERRRAEARRRQPSWADEA